MVSSSNASVDYGSAVAVAQQAPKKRRVDLVEPGDLPAAQLQAKPGFCLARAWSDGYGSQCSHPVEDGVLFCSSFHHRSLPHGRMDGDIPADKMHQFQTAHRKRVGELSRKVQEGPASLSEAVDCFCLMQKLLQFHLRPQVLKHLSVCFMRDRGQSFPSVRDLFLYMSKEDLVDLLEVLGGALSGVAPDAASLGDASSSVAPAAASSGGASPSVAPDVASCTKCVEQKACALRALRHGRALERQLKAAEATYADLSVGLRLYGQGTAFPHMLNRLRLSEARLGWMSGNGVQRREALTEVKPTWTFPCAYQAAALDAEVLSYLQEAPEWRAPRTAWLAGRKEGARPTGFEAFEPAVEEIRHCKSQESARDCIDGLRLFGKDASRPAPARLMAFREALVMANVGLLQGLEQVLKESLQNRSAEELQQFGLDGGRSLALTRAIFSFCTMQMRWGNLAEEVVMQRHIDGGPSLLHLSFALHGCRSLHTEFVERAEGGKVSSVSVQLRPGDVYLSSPACCIHSVSYPPQRAADHELQLLVIHFRSDLLRMRAKPQMFHGSNAMLSEALSPAVAKFLERSPFVLPSLQQVRQAEALMGSTA